MSTYNFGQPPVDALKLQNLQAILNLLPDNSQKLISPKDVRDSIFTTWENIVFKTTKVSSSDIEYIGIDQQLLKSKIFFGKKMVSGKEVMDDVLLSDSFYDYYFYGTRSEPTSNYNTRIGLLAGTGSFSKNGVVSVPYIEAKEVQYTNLEKYIDLDIINRSFVLDGTNQVGGDINIISTRGNVQLNGFLFPKSSENRRPSNNDKYLKFIWDEETQLGRATWSSIGSVDTQSIQSSGLLSISGNPVQINGLDYNFTDRNETPSDVGGIKQGTTFDNVPVTEVLRQLLYPYILPKVQTNFNYTFIESGDTNNLTKLQLNWSITWTSESLARGFLNPSSLRTGSPRFPEVGSLGPGLNTGYVEPQIPSSVPPREGYLTFSIVTTIQDQPERGNEIKATSSCFVVLPWYYGTSETLLDNPRDTAKHDLVLRELNPILRLHPNANESVQVNLDTSQLLNKLGCVYFMYPSMYRDLSNIIDQNGYSVFSDYIRYGVKGISSPNGYWGGAENRTYKVYAYAPNGTVAFTQIPPLSKYTFVF